MDRAGAEPEGGAGNPGDDDDGWRPRRHDRCRMFRPAHLVVGDAVLDCVLVDVSPDGAQVCLVAWADLPERVTLLVPGAGSRPLRRRWQRGFAPQSNVD